MVSTRCTEATMQWPKKSGSLNSPAKTQEELGPDGLHGSISGATLVSPTMCIERSTFFSFGRISVLSRWQKCPLYALALLKLKIESKLQKIDF